MIKKLGILVFCVAILCSGCSDQFRALSGKDKVLYVADTVAYYGQYLSGVKSALPYLATYFPPASGLITGVLSPLITVADSALEAYRMGRGTVGEVQNAINQINEVVGDVKGE